MHFLNNLKKEIRSISKPEETTLNLHMANRFAVSFTDGEIKKKNDSVYCKR